MAIQLIEVSTGNELKSVKTNGFFRLHNKVYVADLYAGSKEGGEILVINREVAVTDLDNAITVGKLTVTPGQ